MSKGINYFKKSVLVLSSSFLLAGYIGPSFLTLAETSSEEETTEELEEVNDEIEESGNDEDIEEEIEGESVGTLENNESEIQEQNIEESDNYEEETSDGEYKVFLEESPDAYLHLNDSFVEFLDEYGELTEEAIQENIKNFKLYVDDENTVHSGFYEDFYPDQLGASENTDLVEKLQGLQQTNYYEEEEVFSDNQPADNSEVLMNQLVETSSTRNTTVDRISGQNREAVSVNVSQRGWNSSNTVVIANGYQFTDALSGTPLAAHYGAPMLLVNDRSISNATLNEINRLGAQNVIVLGGPASVPEQTLTTLRNRGLSVERIAGNNRYDTSRKIAERLISLRGPSTAHLVNGDAYADAVSISSVAGRYRQPILLTRSNELHPEVQQITNSVKDWRIIGGPNSVSSNTENQLNNRVNNVTRLTGQNRYEVNRRVLNHWGVSGSQVYVGHGNAFADVLSGSVLAARENTGVLLVSGNATDIANAQDYAQSRNLDRFTLLGGERTLGNQIVQAFERLYRPVVYIDPGHGGTDSGASFGGVHEKNLALSQANRIRDQLEATGNYNVVMSRTTDTFVKLANRAQDANRRNVDIFISVHFNSMGGAGTARGVESFIYNAGGYTTSPNPTNQRLRDSLTLANHITPLVASRTGLNNRGVRGHNLHVVRETNMPAVLMEYGFIDNVTERNIVRQATFQNNAAQATRDGINRYFGF